VTVMFDRYFGLPQHVIRSGQWAQMKPSEQSLYVCLMFESEHYSSREIKKSDADLHNLTGLSPRAFCNARKKLQERGLVFCRRGRGNVYVYVICNPETGSAWPGDPKHRIVYRRKQDLAAEGEVGMHVRSPSTSASAVQSLPAAPIHRNPERPLESHGVPLPKF